MPPHAQPVLILGGTGTTGSLTATALARQGTPVRAVSRSTAPSFDWSEPATWDPSLRGVAAVYMLPAPGEIDPSPAMTAFIDRALALGVQRFVLLSASAIEPGSPGVGQIARMLPDAVPEWAILRPSWFMQNFTDPGHYMAQDLRSDRRLYTSTGTGRIAFIDAHDIAAVAAAMLTKPGPPQAELVLTGPDAISYDEVAATLADAIGEDVRHEHVDVDRVAARMRRQGIPADFAGVLAGLEADLRAGSEDRVTDTVQRVTGLPPRSFAAFATGNADVWRER